MKAHIDADILVYAAGFAAERRYYTVTSYDPEFDEVIVREFQYMKEVKAYMEDQSHACVDFEIVLCSEAEPVENALHNLLSMVEKIKTNLELNESDIVMHLSGETNFREGIATIKGYKANRKDSLRPKHAGLIKNYIKKNWTTIVSDNEEADDTMGYSHFALYVQGEPSIIATCDKDLDMIPGMHYNTRKQEVYQIDEYQAELCFYEQLLKGDTVDNIQGVKGCGAITASKALEDAGSVREMEEIVEAMYRKGYGDTWYEALLENGRLLWIRREPNQMWLPQYITGDTNE